MKQVTKCTDNQTEFKLGLTRDELKAIANGKSLSLKFDQFANIKFMFTVKCITDAEDKKKLSTIKRKK